MLSVLPLLVINPAFLTGTVEVVLAILVSFIIITVISSYYRFQHIVEMAEETQPEDMGAEMRDIVRIQLARFLASCARHNSAFTVSLMRINIPGIKVRLDGPVTAALKKDLRSEDIICIYDDNTLSILTETEPEDAEAILHRVITYLKDNCPDMAGQDLRVGISSYPKHALSGREMLNIAEEALEQTSIEQPVLMPDVVDVDEKEEEETEGIESQNAGQNLPEDIVSPDEEEPETESDAESQESAGKRRSRKDAMLDDLTGVLKPTAISAYMQRMIAEIRRKKKSASLFAIGVNNIDHIARFHGEDAAADVLAGISKVLQDNLRTADLIGRHERDAFLVLTQATLEEAEGIGKRLSTLVQKHVVTSGSKKLKTTIMVGVAAYPDHGRNLHHLYKAAQKVLDFNRANDIRAYAVYNADIHDAVPSKPLSSIKASKV